MENLLFALTVQQQSEERDMVVQDLFAIKSDEIKATISNLDAHQKEFLIKKAINHMAFYKRIAEEETKKPSFRIEVAKFRVTQLYPQLLKLLGYEHTH